MCSAHSSLCVKQSSEIVWQMKKCFDRLHSIYSKARTQLQQSKVAQRRNTCVFFSLHLFCFWTTMKASITMYTNQGRHHINKNRDALYVTWTVARVNALDDNYKEFRGAYGPPYGGSPAQFTKTTSLTHIGSFLCYTHFSFSNSRYIYFKTFQALALLAVLSSPSKTLISIICSTKDKISNNSNRP